MHRNKQLNRNSISIGVISKYRWKNLGKTLKKCVWIKFTYRYTLVKLYPDYRGLVVNSNSDCSWRKIWFSIALIVPFNFYTFKNDIMMQLYYLEPEVPWHGYQPGYPTRQREPPWYFQRGKRTDQPGPWFCCTESGAECPSCRCSPANVTWGSGHGRRTSGRGWNGGRCGKAWPLCADDLWCRGCRCICTACPFFRTTSSRCSSHTCSKDSRRFSSRHDTTLVYYLIFC